MPHRRCPDLSESSPSATTSPCRSKYPAPTLGTNHDNDPAMTRTRLDDSGEATIGATDLRIHRGAATTDGALLTLTGCTSNSVVLDEPERLGCEVCAPEVLGHRHHLRECAACEALPATARSTSTTGLRRANSTALRSTPAAVSTGAWLCDDDVFSGIFVPSYPSTAGIFEVASETSASGPGGEYGEATYADLRLGGVEIIVRHLVEIERVIP